MKAMRLEEFCDLGVCSTPLVARELPEPVPGEGDLLVRVSVCGVCHTELDEIEGRIAPAVLPITLGHQVVGRVEAMGPRASRFAIGDRVGVAWIFGACGRCRFCRRGLENLCPEFSATGRDADGGYAELTRVHEDFAYPIPDSIADSQAAPLLCAGAIGFRSLELAQMENGDRLGLTGFGASGHLVLKMARHRFPQSEVFVFARSPEEQAFAREIGAAWAGGTEARSPEKLDAIIDTTPVWKPIVEALANLEAGGRVVINAIRKQESDKEVLLSLDYPEHLWLEKEVKSVANITRADVDRFLTLAAEMQIQPELREFELGDTNQALLELHRGGVPGAKILRIG